MSQAKNTPQAAAAHRKAIKRLVINAGNAGIRISAVMACMKLSNHTVGLHLRSLHAAGEIEPSGDTGAGVRWGPVGIRAYTDAMRTKEAERKRERRASAAAGFESPDDQWAQQPPKRVIVPALGRPAPYTSAPASAWELAA